MPNSTLEQASVQTVLSLCPSQAQIVFLTSKSQNTALCVCIILAISGQASCLKINMKSNVHAFPFASMVGDQYLGWTGKGWAAVWKEEVAHSTGAGSVWETHIPNLKGESPRKALLKQHSTENIWHVAPHRAAGSGDELNSALLLPLSSLSVFSGIISHNTNPNLPKDNQPKYKYTEKSRFFFF